MNATIDPNAVRVVNKSKHPLPEDATAYSAGMDLRARPRDDRVEAQATVARLAPRLGVELVRVTDEDEYFPPPRNIRELQAAIGISAATLLGGDPKLSSTLDDRNLAASTVLAALHC